MQNFKLFFKLLNKYKGQMIMYVGIFSSIVCGIIRANSSSPSSTYQTKECSYVVFDEDQSQISKAVCDYLESNNKKIEGIENDERKIQDGIYYSEIDCAVFIPSGFEKKVLEGNAGELIEIKTFAGSQTSVLFETSLDNYINIFSNYLKIFDGDVKSAVEKTNNAVNVNVDVKLQDGKKSSVVTPAHTYFIYLAWIMIMVLVNGIGPVLISLKEKEVKKRIFCSSCKFSSMQLSLFAGMSLVGFFVTVFFVVLGKIIVGKSDVPSFYFFQGLNLLCYAIFSLALTYLFCAITRKLPILSMLCNVVSLGMAFLCGIFIPIDFLSKGIVKVAHFLPAFWYGRAVDVIEQSGPNLEMVYCLGIELLFAATLFVIGGVVNRKNNS